MIGVRGIRNDIAFSRHSGHIWAHPVPFQDMPKRTASPPVFDESRQRWKATVPASLSPSGRRIRAWFKTRDEARAYVGDVTDPAGVAATVSPKLAEDADTARQRLEKAGLDMTVAEAVREFVAAREALGGAGGLLDAATEYRRRHEARLASKPFGEAVASFLDTKEEVLRPRTMESYRYTLEGIFSGLNDATLADLSTEDFQGVLARHKPTARRMHVRTLRAFMRWCARPPRRWTELEAIDELEIPTVTASGEISVLRPAEARALLRAAEGYSPHAACAFAVAIFAGVRMGELADMTWGDVKEGHLEIRPAVAKRGTRRVVTMCEALRAWLDACRPGDADVGDRIVGGNWREVSKRVRRLAGWDVAARGLEVAPPEPTRGRWPQNVCRHTSASMLVALGEPLETLLFQHGHAGGHELLRRHYVGTMTKAEAVEILSIGPGGEELPALRSA